MGSRMLIKDTQESVTDHVEYTHRPIARYTHNCHVLKINFRQRGR